MRDAGKLLRAAGNSHGQGDPTCTTGATWTLEKGGGSSPSIASWRFSLLRGILPRGGAFRWRGTWTNGSSTRRDGGWAFAFLTRMWVVLWGRPDLACFYSIRPIFLIFFFYFLFGIFFSGAEDTNRWRDRLEYEIRVSLGQPRRALAAF